MPTPLFNRGRMVSTCKYMGDVYLYVLLRKVKKIRGTKEGRKKGRKEGRKKGREEYGKRKGKEVSV